MKPALSKSIRNRTALVSCAALLMACAGQPPASEPAPTTGATKSVKSGILLREDWHAKAVVDRDDSIILTLPSGERQLQHFDRRAVFTVSTDGSGRVSIRLDSLTYHPRASADGATPEGSWAGQATDPSINALHLTGGGAQAAELTSVVRCLLPRLPLGGIRSQMSWIDSAQGNVRVDIFTANERRTAVWSTGSPSTRAGDEVIPVRVREDFEQLGDGSQGGRRMTMTSQGRRSGTYYMTRDGRMSSARLDDSVAMLISIPSSKQVVPTMRYGRTVVRFSGE